MFAHGSNIHFGPIKPLPRSTYMIAPKAPVIASRELFNEV